LTYWKAWRFLNRYSVAHKYDKPRICPILVDSDDGELMNLDGMKLRTPNDVYLRIIVIRATDELLWSIGYALGDGTYTDDSFRLLGSPRKLSVEVVVKTYVDKLAEMFTKGKYHVNYYVWDEKKSDRVRIEDPSMAEKWQIRLQSRVLTRIYKAIRKNCEFVDVLARNWKPVFAGIFDSDGHLCTKRGKWVIISQSVGEKFDVIRQFLTSAKIDFKLWSGGGPSRRRENYKNVKPNHHLAVGYKDVKDTILKYSIGMRMASLENRRA